MAIQAWVLAKSPALPSSPNFWEGCLWQTCGKLHYQASKSHSQGFVARSPSAAVIMDTLGLQIKPHLLSSDAKQVGQGWGLGRGFYIQQHGCTQPLPRAGSSHVLLDCITVCWIFVTVTVTVWCVLDCEVLRNHRSGHALQPYEQGPLLVRHSPVSLCCAT